MALRCKSRSEFKKGYPGAHVAAQRHGWLKKIYSHMKEIKKPNGYWTKKNLHIEALKYKHRKEFELQSSSAYMIARKNGFLNEICGHMEPFGNRFFRMIYAQEFKSTKTVYVGLTGRIKKRRLQHIKQKREAVYKHMSKTNLIPVFKIHSDYIPVKEAQKLENEIKEKYIKEGWIVLNKMPAGGLGGNILKWDFEKCREVALKCKTKIEFWRKYSGAYASAYKNMWLDEICVHMKTATIKN